MRALIGRALWWFLNGARPKPETLALTTALQCSGNALADLSSSMLAGQYSCANVPNHGMALNALCQANQQQTGELGEFRYLPV